MKQVYILLIIFSAISNPAFSQADTYFFSQEDMQNIRKSAQTSWGKAIVDSLKIQVAERLKHPLEVPEAEAGHLHDFFCPVHNVMLDFDWDKPTEHYCSFCGKSWSSDRINWAWITVLQGKNKTFLTSCLYLYLATGDRQYAGHIKKMLLDYAAKYPVYKVHDKGRNTPEPADYSAKMFAQSLDEAVWFSEVCRTYPVIKPLLSKKEAGKIETGLFREAANLLLKRGGGGNWQVWNNSGLAALGVALNDDSIVDVAVNHPKVGYRHMMEAHVNKDGWWNENSPNYHFYPLQAMLLTADAVRCKGYNLYDQQLEYMLLAPVKGIYNDLSFPSHNDGWYGESLLVQVKLYETGYARYRNPLFLEALQTCYSRESRNAPEALLTNAEIKGSDKMPELNSYVFAQTGYALLRNGNKTIGLKYGPSGGGHGHPDKLSITIHNGFSEILPDFGTCAYGIPDYLNWYKRTLSHNTVTVDFKDQRPATGQLVFSEPDAVEAFTDKAYPGTTLRRKLSFRGNHLYDEFECISDSLHTYDYSLMLTEKPRIDETFAPSVLDGNVPYRQIKNVQKASLKNRFIIRTASAEIAIEVVSPEPFEIFTGEASGIPPTNPSVKTVSGSEKRPVQPCYPVIIRTNDKNMKIISNWNLLK